MRKLRHTTVVYDTSIIIAERTIPLVYERAHAGDGGEGKGGRGSRFETATLKTQTGQTIEHFRALWAEGGWGAPAGLKKRLYLRND